MSVASRDVSSEEPQNDDASSTASWSLLDATPRDPFDGLSIEVPYKSRPLFQLCEYLTVLQLIVKGRR